MSKTPTPFDAIFGREEPCGSEFLQREKKKELKNGTDTKEPYAYP